MERSDASKPFQGLSREELRAQLASYLLSEKQLKGSIQTSIEEYELWKSRLAMAKEQGREELAEGARSRMEEISRKLADLNLEFDALAAELQQVKAEIKEAELSQKGRASGVDPEALLANIENLAGKSAEASRLERDLRDSEADELLADLKARLMQDPPEEKS